jgi:gag-polypeptide of LTR copia-type
MPKAQHLKGREKWKPWRYAWEGLLLASEVVMVQAAGDDPGQATRVSLLYLSNRGDLKWGAMLVVSMEPDPLQYVGGTHKGTEMRIQLHNAYEASGPVMRTTLFSELQDLRLGTGDAVQYSMDFGRLVRELAEVGMPVEGEMQATMFIRGASDGGPEWAARQRTILRMGYVTPSVDHLAADPIDEMRLSNKKGKKALSAQGGQGGRGQGSQQAQSSLTTKARPRTAPRTPRASRPRARRPRATT